jgi:hypothetical protein
VKSAAALSLFHWPTRTMYRTLIMMEKKSSPPFNDRCDIKKSTTSSNQITIAISLHSVLSFPLYCASPFFAFVLSHHLPTLRPRADAKPFTAAVSNYVLTIL